MLLHADLVPTSKTQLFITKCITDIHRPILSVTAPYLQNDFSVATSHLLRARCQSFTQLRCNNHLSQNDRPYNRLACLRCNPTAEQDQGQLVYNAHLPPENISHTAMECILLKKEREEASAAEGILLTLTLILKTDHSFPKLAQLSLLMANDPPHTSKLRTKIVVQWRKLALPHCAAFALQIQHALSQQIVRQRPNPNPPD